MTNCDTEFRNASFAGIEFEILGSDHNGGRRVITHEYPFQDDHYNEDLGDNPMRWSVKGLFVGEGWRDRFTEAKARWGREGAADFFEPTENRLYQAVLTSWSYGLDHTALNSVEFSIDLVEKGLEPYLNIGGSPRYLAATALDRYIEGLGNWYFPRLDLYNDIAQVFRAYDNVRGYLTTLKRQFLGLGSFLSVGGSVDAMQPSRSLKTNFDQAAAVYESVRESGDDNAEAFYRNASELRLAGDIETEDQAIMAAGLALGYFFESVSENATRGSIEQFRLRADSLKQAANDPAIQTLIDGLISSLGRSAEIECRATLAGNWNALVASYEVYGDVSRAAEMMALSGGVSGASINGVTYECPA